MHTELNRSKYTKSDAESWKNAVEKLPEYASKRVKNNTPPINSNKDNTTGSCLMTSFALIIANVAERKADTSAKTIPSTYWVSTLKISAKPPTTSNPNTISYPTIFFLLTIGSINEVKKAPVDRHAKVTETLETLIALKNVNQCKAITVPASKKTAICLREYRHSIPL